VGVVERDVDLKPVLVTGGAGFFGTVLVRHLRQREVPVRVLDINLPDPVPSGVTVVQGDVRDRAIVRAACEGVDVIHHNVALVPLARDRQGFWSVNEGGTRTLLEGALAAGVRKVVHMSSSAIYGAPKSNPVDESTTPEPGEEYGRAKLAAENLCREFRDRGLDITIVRPRTIMGHGRLGIMQILFEWVRQGLAIPVLGGGRNQYQFIHGDDLADACLAAADRSGSADYNIGAAAFGTMRETLQGLIAHAGTGSRVVSVPMAPAAALTRWAGRLGLSPLGPYHALMYGRPMWFDITRARRELHFQPRFSNIEMLCQSYDWYLANRDLILQRTMSSPHSMAVKQRALALLPHLLTWLPAVES
jgi:nucleoside-diphosphate-sugar epimerase